MTPRVTRIIGFVAFALFAAVVLLLPLWISSFRAQQFAYVGIYLIALLGLNILTGYTGQISLGHGAFMAIGGYTTLPHGGERAGGVARDRRRDEGRLDDSDRGSRRRPRRPCVRAARASALGGYLALATFAIAVAMPSVIKRFEEFSGGGSGVNLFGLPELTASINPVEIFGQELVFNDWLYLCWSIALVAFAVAWLILRPDGRARSAPCGTARRLRSRRA